MTALMRAPAGALTRSDPRKLSLFRATAGKQLIGPEVDEAVEWCEIYGANPFLKDIYFFVFDAGQADKRRVVPVLSIGLYRKIATRTGDYRPDEAPPRFTYDEALQGLDNPRGIVDCTVTIQVYRHGSWFPVSERLRWDERAPIVETGTGGTKWEDTGEVYPPGHKKAGKPKFRKVAVGEEIAALDPAKPNWRTMPETMLAKCTEAAAIRKAFPEQTNGSFGEGELDRAEVLDLTATEIIDGENERKRFERIGGDRSVTIDWLDGKPLERVPAGQFGDRAIAYVQQNHDEPMSVLAWVDRNRHAIQEYWAPDPSGALELKKVTEPFQAHRLRGAAE